MKRLLLFLLAISAFSQVPAVNSGTAVYPPSGTIMIGGNNLSEITAAATARTNLGLGSAAIVNTPISGANGGTGVNNGASTITLGGSLTTSGAFASTFTMTGATSVTFPTSGTLSTTTGTVTSVGQSFTGGLISVAGSPITTSGTLALTVAGTSGGIPYFSGAATWASSAALGANGVVIGGGAGAAPSSLATANNAVLVTSNTGVPSEAAPTSPLAVSASALTCTTCATTTNGGALSATAPATISAAGVIACATCATTTNGGALAATAPVTISAAGLIACATCATTTNGGALSATQPITLSAAGVIAANAVTGTGNTIVEQTSPAITTPSITTGINDANANSMLAFTATTSAVDGFTFTNAATANPGIVQLAGTGTDANVTMKMLPKGTGIFNVGAGTLPANTGEMVVYRTGTPTGIVIAGGSTEGAPTTSTDGVALYMAHNGAANRQLIFGDSAATINSTSVGIRFFLGGATPSITGQSLDDSTSKAFNVGATTANTTFIGAVAWLQGATCSFIGPSAPSSNTCTGTLSSFDSTASTGAAKITFGNDGSGTYTGTHSSTTTTQVSVVDGLVQSTTNQLQGQGSTGTVGWALNGAGKMKTYQALATVGPGVSPIYGNVSTTGNTAAITTSTLCAAAVCTGGEYILHAYLNSTVTCAVVGTASVGLNLTYTDDAGTKTTQTIPLRDNNALTLSSTMALGDTTTYADAWFSFWSTGANAIQYATTYTACGTGTGTYSIRLALEQQI